MATIEIYSSPFCGFCYRAKQLLDGKQAAYTEFNILMNSEKRDEMLSRAGGRDTVPQIFINDMHIGGCDELYALERAGDLDPLLIEAVLAS
jgi:glutaredoxin 3